MANFEQFQLLKKVRLLKIIFASIGALVLFIILSLIIFIHFSNKPRPILIQEPNSQKILTEVAKKINFEIKKEIRIIQYRYKSKLFIYNLKEKKVTLESSKNLDLIKVVFEIENKTGRVFENNVEIREEKQVKKLVHQAIEDFYYSIFWVHPLLLSNLPDVKISEEKSKIQAEKNSKDIKSNVFAFELNPLKKKEPEIFLIEWKHDLKLLHVKIWHEDIPFKGIEANFSNFTKKEIEKENSLILPAQRKLWFWQILIEDIILSL